MVWRVVIQSVTGILPLHISTDLPPVFRAVQEFLIMPVSNGAILESGFMPAFFIKFIVFGFPCFGLYFYILCFYYSSRGNLIFRKVL